MKRFITAFMFIFVTLFIFSSCNNTSSSVETPIVSTQKEEIISPFKTPDVSMRDWVENYMREMSKVVWTPSQDMDLTKDYAGNTVGKTLYFKKGEIYHGLPYVNLSTDSDLEDFTSALQWDEENSVYVYDCPSDRKGEEALGNDCSSAILHAWKRFDTDIYAYDTGSCFPLDENTGIHTIGNLKTDKSDKTTDTIISKNGSEKIFIAYSKLQKGDMLIWRLKNGNSTTGHTRMVVDVHVSKTLTGKINPAASYVTTIEQTNQFDPDAANDGKNTTWWVDHKYSFSMLLEKSFIPVTCRAFSEELPTPNITLKDVNTKKTIGYVNGNLYGSIKSNYPILSVTVNIKDINNNIIHSQKHKPKIGHIIEMVSLGIFKIDNTTLTAGEYIYTIEVETVCGFGEVYNIEFSKK